MLRFTRLQELTLSPGHLAWPWVAFAADRSAFALPLGGAAIELRQAAGGPERRVELPPALAVPDAAASLTGTTSRQPGLHALALLPDGGGVVGLGWSEGRPVGSVALPGAPASVVELGTALGDLGPMRATERRSGCPPKARRGR